MKLDSTKIMRSLLAISLAVTLPALAHGQSAYVRIEGSRLRSTPNRSAKSEVVGLLYVGSHVHVVSTHGGWTKVRYLTTGNRWVQGYINSNLLTSTVIPPNPPTATSTGKPTAVAQIAAPEAAVPAQQVEVAPSNKVTTRGILTKPAPPTETPHAVAPKPAAAVPVLAKKETVPAKPLADKSVDKKIAKEASKKPTRKPASLVCATKFDHNSPAIAALEKAAGTGIDGSRWSAKDEIGFHFSSSGNIIVTLTSLSSADIDKIAAAAQPPVSEAKVKVGLAFGYIAFNAKVCTREDGTFSVALSGIPGYPTAGKNATLAVRPLGNGKLFLSGNILGSQINESFTNR